MFNPFKWVFNKFRAEFVVVERKRKLNLKVLQLGMAFLSIALAIQWQSQPDNEMLEDTVACFQNTRQSLLGQVAQSVEEQIKLSLEEDLE